MANHPKRHRGPYKATATGPGLVEPVTSEFRSLRECGAWAEAQGPAADRCVITDRKGDQVRALRCHRGMWFPEPPPHPAARFLESLNRMPPEKRARVATQLAIAARDVFGDPPEGMETLLGPKLRKPT